MKVQYTNGEMKKSTYLVLSYNTVMVTESQLLRRDRHVACMENNKVQKMLVVMSSLSIINMGDSSEKMPL
jgi:hypothetical protein